MEIKMKTAEHRGIQMRRRVWAAALAAAVTLT